MANTTLTHLMVARMAAKILEEEAPFIMGINLGRQEEFGDAIGGYKRGDTVKVRIPPVGKVFNTEVFADGGAGNENVETFVNLTMDTRRHVALQFSAKEQLLELTDFTERFLRPQIRVLSSVVESDLLVVAKNATPNLVGTAGTIPSTMKTYGQARAKLQQFLAPPSDRSMLYSSDANVELVDASKALFHKDTQIEKGFLRGLIGEAQNAMFYEHQSMPVHTNGTQNMSVMLVNGAPAEGATTVAIDGGTGTNTIKKGTIITFGTTALNGVFAVHPLTGVASAVLQQFVVTADVTLAAGAGTISIFPALKSVAPNKTVSILPVDNNVITMVGAASAAMRQNLMFQKDAFTAAFPPLPVLASTTGYTARLPSGISCRVSTFGDGTNDFERTRIDVLFGMVAVRGLHAVRVTE